MWSFSKQFLGLTAVLLCAAPPAGAQISRREPLVAPAATTEPTTGTIVDPNAPPPIERSSPVISRLPQRSKALPTIAGVPERIAWGDEITITGTNFISPVVELYAPVLGSASSIFHYPLKTYQVTPESFKLFIQRGVVGSANPMMRLKVTTAYGTDTSKTECCWTSPPASTRSW